MKVYNDHRNSSDANFVILDDDAPKTKYLCECYGEFGVKLGCYDAGCYTKETSDNFRDGDDETHIEVEVFEYHDGHNWVTLLIGENEVNQTDLSEVEDDLNYEVIEHFEKADWGEWNRGICQGETDKYIFTKSQWQGSFGIADVEVK